MLVRTHFFSYPTAGWNTVETLSYLLAEAEHLESSPRYIDPRGKAHEKHREWRLG